MIVLGSTTRKLQVLLGGAITTNQLQCYAAYRDITATPTYVPGSSEVLTNSTTSVDFVAAPAASTYRVIDHISVFNNDTVAQTVTVRVDVSGTAKILVRASVAADKTLIYDTGGAWRTFP